MTTEDKHALLPNEIITAISILNRVFGNGARESLCSLCVRARELYQLLAEQYFKILKTVDDSSEIEMWLEKIQSRMKTVGEVIERVGYKNGGSLISIERHLTKCLSLTIEAGVASLSQELKIMAKVKVIKDHLLLDLNQSLSNGFSRDYNKKALEGLKVSGSFVPVLGQVLSILDATEYLASWFDKPVDMLQGMERVRNILAVQYIVQVLDGGVLDVIQQVLSNATQSQEERHQLLEEVCQNCETWCAAADEEIRLANLDEA